MNKIGTTLLILDSILLAIFVVEIALRLFVHRLNFFKDPWSIFDFCVVAIALMPSQGALSVLRALRILRALRLISTIKSLRRVVSGLLGALPGMGSIVVLLGLVFYVFSVMATKLYGEGFPEFFGTLGSSAYSLFQIMTLESWSMGIVRPVMDVYPYAWAFFLPFILLTSFTVLNLFIGIIVSSMQSEHQKVVEEEAQQLAATEQSHFEQLRSEIRELKQEIRNLKHERE